MTTSNQGLRRRASAWTCAVLAVALVALVAGSAVAHSADAASAAPAASAALAGHPVVALQGPSSGQAAIDALGIRLPRVAGAYGLTAAQLQYRFGQDKHLNVDRNGYLFYNEPTSAAANLAAGAAAAGAPAATPLALAPLTDTFKLHSLPGAAHIVYLDFDGQTMSGNAWTAGYNGGADIVAPPFDTDGIPGTFSDAELTAIQQTWQRVAEDYAPFNVDVTTEYLGESYLTRTDSADNLYGNRVLISPMSSYIGRYGGISYVGVFNAVGDYYKTSLVFPENLAKNERYIAEAASHENGHSLGLSHDGLTTGTEYYSGQGSGVTGWAPIMGVGNYQQLTQWSKGEYLNANNKEDDIAKMVSYGALLRADDAGGTIATATVLAGSGTLTAAGLVGAGGDADYYKVACGAGALTVSVATAERGPDLDVALELQDGAGTVIASSNPADLLTASLSANVGAGTYYLVVKGTGKGDPLATGYTAYGSMGAYTVSASVPAAGGNAAPIASFSTDRTTGDIPVSVAFDGSASSDTDGTIASYAWTFGDGATATGAVAAHAYIAAGTYTATLTVTDDQGATGSKSVSITATAPNAAPTAKITTDKTSGPTPLVVAFSGAGSSDIASYSWTFGDGATSTAATVSHTYSAAGVYTATLKVTDNRGATSTATTSITATQDPAKLLKVASITITRVRSGSRYRPRAVVKIVNGSGAVVSSVTVTGKFTGAVTGAVSGRTGTAGTVTLQSNSYSGTARAKFTITGVSKARYVWVP